MVHVSQGFCFKLFHWNHPKRSGTDTIDFHISRRCSSTCSVGGRDVGSQWWLGAMSHHGYPTGAYCWWVKTHQPLGHGDRVLGPLGGFLGNLRSHNWNVYIWKGRHAYCIRALATVSIHTYIYIHISLLYVFVACLHKVGWTSYWNHKVGWKSY